VEEGKVADDDDDGVDFAATAPNVAAPLMGVLVPSSLDPTDPASLPSKSLAVAGAGATALAGGGGGVMIFPSYFSRAILASDVGASENSDAMSVVVVVVVVVRGGGDTSSTANTAEGRSIAVVAVKNWERAERRLIISLLLESLLLWGRTSAEMTTLRRRRR
jgi:hypothetical protein